MKAIIIIMVALSIDDLISDDALNTTSVTFSLSPAGLRTFFLSCLKLFSTSIIASSTSDPIAMAIPPRLMVFMVYPRSFSVIRVTTSESGIAIREIKVVLGFSRKKKSIRTTKNPPSRRAFRTLFTEVLMKSA